MVTIFTSKINISILVLIRIIPAANPFITDGCSKKLVKVIFLRKRNDAEIIRKFFPTVFKINSIAVGKKRIILEIKRIIRKLILENIILFAVFKSMLKSYARIK